MFFIQLCRQAKVTVLSSRDETVYYSTMAKIEACLYEPNVKAKIMNKDQKATFDESDERYLSNNQYLQFNEYLLKFVTIQEKPPFHTQQSELILLI